LSVRMVGEGQRLEYGEQGEGDEIERTWKP